MLVVLDVFGQKLYQLGAVEGVEHLEAEFAAGVQLHGQFVHVRHKREVLRNQHQQGFGLPHGAVGDFLDGGQVGVNHQVGDFGKLNQVVFLRVFVKRVVAILQIGGEVFQHLGLLEQVVGDFDVPLQEVVQGDGFGGHCALKCHIFAQ